MTPQEIIEAHEEEETEHFYTPTITPARQANFAARLMVPGKVISGVGDESMAKLIRLVKLQNWENLMVKRAEPRKLS